MWRTGVHSLAVKRVRSAACGGAGRWRGEGTWRVAVRARAHAREHNSNNTSNLIAQLAVDVLGELRACSYRSRQAIDKLDQQFMYSRGAHGARMANASACTRGQLFGS